MWKLLLFSLSLCFILHPTQFAPWPMSRASRLITCWSNPNMSHYWQTWNHTMESSLMLLFLPHKEYVIVWILLASGKKREWVILYWYSCVDPTFEEEEESTKCLNDIFSSTIILCQRVGIYKMCLSFIIKLIKKFYNSSIVTGPVLIVVKISRPLATHPLPPLYRL